LQDYKKLKMNEELWKYKEWLIEELNQSNADWKIVFAHHPLYTKGKRHGKIAKCLREEIYQDSQGREAKGYGMENVLIQGGVQLYISGHEHVLQHKVSQGINYAVVFSGLFKGFYGGEEKSENMDWWKVTSGFLAVTVTKEEIILKYVGEGAMLLHSVTIPKKEKIL